MKKLLIFLTLTLLTGFVPGYLFAGVDAAYVDTWHYQTPQLYLSGDMNYSRYDILKNRTMGTNTIKRGYPGVPFKGFDAAYVDTWHYRTPQLYIFSGKKYARYDILTNKYMGSNSIINGFPGVPFETIDAAYVDTWHYKTPQLYLFSGTKYIRYDILTNKFMGQNDIRLGYPGLPFKQIDAAYVDTWHYKTPQLYLFSGSEYARYDILKNKFMGKNRIKNGYPGLPFSN